MWETTREQAGQVAWSVTRSYGCDATPLLMLHGVLRGGSTFASLRGALSANYPLILPDQRGHGHTARATSYHVTDYVSDVVGWLIQKHKQPIQIYGHSLGAMVAAAVAAEVPELVEGVILEDPPFHTMGCRMANTPLQSYFAALPPFAGISGKQPVIAQQLGAVQVTHPTENRLCALRELRDAVTLRYMAQHLQLLDPRVLDSIVAGTWLEGYHPVEVFQEIECPVLVLQGDAACGGMLTDPDVEALRSVTRDLTHLKFNGAGHALHWQRPAEVVLHTLNFLQSLSV